MGTRNGKFQFQASYVCLLPSFLHCQDVGLLIKFDTSHSGPGTIKTWPKNQTRHMDCMCGLKLLEIVERRL